MTTILGIKANSGHEGVVLFSDTQITHLDDDDKPFEKGTDSKIWIGKTWALGRSGSNEKKYLDSFQNYLSGRTDGLKFLKYITGKRKYGKGILGIQDVAFYLSRKQKERLDALVKGEITDAEMSDSEKSFMACLDDDFKPENPFDEYLLNNFQALFHMALDPVEEAIRTGNFYALQSYNAACIARPNNDEEDSDAIELIMASNYQGVELYSVDSRGNLQSVPDNNDLEYLALGTGTEYVDEYINNEMYLTDLSKDFTLDNITIPNAVDLGNKIMEYAALKDPSTNDSANLAVVVADNVRNYASMIKSDLKAARENTFKKIGAFYTVPEKE